MLCVNKEVEKDLLGVNDGLILSPSQRDLLHGGVGSLNTIGLVPGHYSRYIGGYTWAAAAWVQRCPGCCLELDLCWIIILNKLSRL